MAVFIVVALSVWAVLNGYAIWRLSSLVSGLGLHRATPWIVAIVCWISFPLSMWLRGVAPRLSMVLNVVSTNWLGIVFLFCACFLVADFVTLGGLVLKGWVMPLRVGAAMMAVVLSAIAFVQGNRAPVVQREEVEVPGLSGNRDGTKLVFVSDLHLGAQIGSNWFKQLVRQIDSLHPDFVAIGGDLIDHDPDRVVPMIPELRTLKAPLGVWAVLGNHDVYSGTDRSAEIMDQAGYHLLRDDSVELLPGLRLAGVDDIGVRGGEKIADAAVHEALKKFKRVSEGCILLSHTPDGMESAAKRGAGLMLCGHTHGGQIWPFSYLVQMRFPTLAGRFEFGHMTLLVSRGSGTWGPRMRLWRRGEIYLITLRAPKQ